MGEAVPASLFDPSTLTRAAWSPSASLHIDSISPGAGTSSTVESTGAPLAGRAGWTGATRHPTYPELLQRRRPGTRGIRAVGTQTQQGFASPPPSRPTD